MKKFFKEFKAFISRGNVFDLAVGMIIATAFNKIVSSLVNDIIMPLITWSTGAASLKDLSIPLREVDGEVTLAWNYGNFLQVIIDFLIIAFSVFLMVKIVTNSRKKFQEAGEEIIERKQIRAEKRKIKKLAKLENKDFNTAWAEYQEEKRVAAEEKAKKEAEEKAAKEAADKLNNPTQEQLLKEIRDILKQKND